jgi:hypothetical protein
MNDEIIRTFEPAGELAYDLDGSESPSTVLEGLCKRCDSIALMSLIEPPSREGFGINNLNDFDRAVAHLEETQTACLEVFGVTEFPGTECLDRRSYAILEINELVTSKLSNQESIWWPPWEEWEDWAILNKNQLAGYVCSHESFGTLYGTKEDFHGLSITKLRKTDPLEREFFLRGYKIEY